MCYGHVERMDERRIPKQVLEYTPSKRWKRGRPKKGWREGIIEAVKARDLRKNQCNG